MPTEEKSRANAEMDSFSNAQEMLANTSLVERFQEYARIDTTSGEHSDSCPSTERQFVLARLLVEQLRAPGLSDSSMEWG
jgi:di/tripeptidase